jgi:FtsP/CotA-like multicopper oxidase with cupredoxin domain/peroxiredoxin
MARTGVLVGVLCLLGSTPPASPGQPPAPPKGPGLQRAKLPTHGQFREFERRAREMALASRVPFANPPEIHSGNGELRTTLVATYAHNRIGTDRVRLRSYNGFLVGPTLRVRPNDRLRVRLLNDLPAEPDPPAGHDISVPPHGSNTTNFHTHGLHVSPEDNGDNPLLEVPPGGQQEFDIRLGTSNRSVAPHPPGTHWYHPHKHGSAALQLASGMAGALIVEGGLDEVPEIKAARERVLVVQQIPYSADGTLEGRAGFLQVRDWSRLTNRYTTINGLLKPVIELAPGEVERWRFVHAGLSARLNLALERAADGKPGLDFHEVAVDGIAFGRIDRRARLDLTAGGTSDVLVQAPDGPGEYLLVKLADPSARLTEERDKPQGTPEDALARVVVRGPRRAMALPGPEALAGLAPHRDITAVQKHRTLVLGGRGGDSPRWTFDDKTFDPDRTDHDPVVGTAEEWTITSVNQDHPFHIHVNAFQVVSVKDKDGPERPLTPGVWRDTVLIPEGATVKVRMRFEDFAGKTVLHCHKVEHEDQGMMQLIRIRPAARADEAPAGGRDEAAGDARAAGAPDWRLPDADGTVHELRGFAGRRLVLVFFRGMSCAHCLDQLRALADRKKELDAAGVVVVAIGSDPPKAGGAAAGKKSDWPFLVLTDGTHDVFRGYGCYTRRPMHGVFAIDGRGRIRWRKVGETPFPDIDRIVKVAARLPVE